MKQIRCYLLSTVVLVATAIAAGAPMIHTKRKQPDGVATDAASFTAAADTLISRNATYRIIGETYLYAGLHLPGTNEKAKNTKGYRQTPLVEMTDTGEALIDGDAKTTVYTPWFWRRNCKRITVEMTLPGPSKVRRVVVRLPEDPTMRPQNIRLDVRKIDAAWKQVDLIDTGPKKAEAPAETRKASHTFRLAQVECQQIRVMCVDQGVMTPHCGIADIEVYGQGPTTNAKRGLIRSERRHGWKHRLDGCTERCDADSPYIKSLSRPKPIQPPGSNLLTHRSRSKVKLSGTPVSQGDGSMLIDGKRSSLVRIDNKRFSNSQLIAEVDLGGLYIIDAVNVWMPGGKGIENGHINQLHLALSPSQKETDWQIPVDLVVNPYWPNDEAPKPYAIPIGDLDTVGRRVRITANLSGQAGSTRRLAMAEIEVWGRKVDPAGARQPLARLNLRPIRFMAEPVRKLHPGLRWLTKQKVRGVWTGDNLFDDFEGTDKTKGEVVSEAGFNLFANSMGPDRDNRSVSSDLENRLPANVVEARRLNLPYMVKWQYGSNHEEPYPRYRGPDGNLAKRSCCPLNEEYFERHIARWAVAIARGGADGMIIDTEMYESDQTRYPGPCACDECFTAYLKAFSNDWKTLCDQVEAQRRGIWLTTNGAMENYTRFAAKRIEDQYDKLRRRCQQINPSFLFGHASNLEYLPGIERGLGTSSVPCLVLAEREYTFGVDSESFARVRKVREKFPALYLPGAFLVYQDPEMVEVNGLIGSLYADGYWLYYATAILNRPGLEDPKAFGGSYGRVKGTTARDYLGRITAMHHRLDELLTKPSNQWPRSEGLPSDFPLPHRGISGSSKQ